MCEFDATDGTECITFRQLLVWLNDILDERYHVAISNCQDFAAEAFIYITSCMQLTKKFRDDLKVLFLSNVIVILTFVIFTIWHFVYTETYLFMFLYIPALFTYFQSLSKHVRFLNIDKMYILFKGNRLKLVCFQLVFDFILPYNNFVIIAIFCFGIY